MTGLTFEITSARAKPNTASPTIAFALRVTAEEPIEAMVLRAQLRIEPQWRQYTADEKTQLTDLFDAPERWGTTLRALSWADVSLTVPGFAGETQTEIAVPCTYDFDQAATRYIDALGGGEIAVQFLFSGAVFRYGAAGFSTERVPWSCEASYRMRVDTWREAMRACYGDDALIRISSETLRRLHHVRSMSGATSWDALFERLLGAPT